MLQAWSPSCPDQSTAVNYPFTLFWDISTSWSSVLRGAPAPEGCWGVLQWERRNRNTKVGGQKAWRWDHPSSPLHTPGRSSCIHSAGYSLMTPRTQAASQPAASTSAHCHNPGPTLFKCCLPLPWPPPTWGTAPGNTWGAHPGGNFTFAALTSIASLSFFNHLHCYVPDTKWQRWKTKTFAWAPQGTPFSHPQI